MRLLLLALSLIGTAALACNTPSMCKENGNDTSKTCGSNSGCEHGCKGKAILEPISYALSELNLKDNDDIKLAIKQYKQEMRTLKPHIPADAFADGKFDPEVYAKSATPAKALKAQSDLFETIYLVLNEEQKKEFATLIGIYQHHMNFTKTQKTCSTMPKSCHDDSSHNESAKAKCCDGKGSAMPMKKLPVPAKH